MRYQGRGRAAVERRRAILLLHPRRESLPHDAVTPKLRILRSIENHTVEIGDFCHTEPFIHSYMKVLPLAHTSRFRALTVAHCCRFVIVSLTGSDSRDNEFSQFHR